VLSSHGGDADYLIALVNPTRKISNQEGKGSRVEVKAAAEQQLSVIAHSQIVSDDLLAGYSHGAAKFPIKTQRKSRHRDQPEQGTVHHCA